MNQLEDYVEKSLRHIMANPELWDYTTGAEYDSMYLCFTGTFTRDGLALKRIGGEIHVEIAGGMTKAELHHSLFKEVEDFYTKWIEEKQRDVVVEHLQDISWLQG